MKAVHLPSIVVLLLLAAVPAGDQAASDLATYQATATDAGLSVAFTLEPSIPEFSEVHVQATIEAREPVGLVSIVALSKTLGTGLAELSAGSWHPQIHSFVTFADYPPDAAADKDALLLPFMRQRQGPTLPYAKVVVGQYTPEPIRAPVGQAQSQSVPFTLRYVRLQEDRIATHTIIREGRSIRLATGMDDVRAALREGHEVLYYIARPEDGLPGARTSIEQSPGLLMLTVPVTVTATPRAVPYSEAARKAADSGGEPIWYANGGWVIREKDNSGSLLKDGQIIPYPNLEAWVLAGGWPARPHDRIQMRPDDAMELKHRWPAARITIEPPQIRGWATSRPSPKNPTRAYLVFDEPLDYEGILEFSRQLPSGFVITPGAWIQHKRPQTPTSRPTTTRAARPIRPPGPAHPAGECN